MCTNCLPHRDAHLGVGKFPFASVTDPGSTEADGVLTGPISRAQLLRAVGGGLAAALTAGALQWSPVEAARAALPYVVLIVLDGARSEYFSVPGVPHVAALIGSGTQYTNAFAGILESETPSGHVSIATGCEPRTTGIPSFWWATRDNVRISLFSPTKIRDGDMEKIVRQARVPTLAGRVHARARNAKVVALSGSKYYAADAIGGPDADITMYFQRTAKGQWAPTAIPGHTPPAGLLSSPDLVAPATQLPLGRQNHLAMQLAVDTFNRLRQQVTLINLPEFDWPLGHVDGGVLDPVTVTTLMQCFDQDLAMLQDAYQRAGVLNRTIFVLLADHGMTPLTDTVSQSDIRAAVSRAGARIVTDAYSSGAFLWLKDGSRAHLAARSIAQLGNPLIQSVYAQVRTSKGLIYTRLPSANLGRTPGIEAANQYLLQSFNGPTGPDVVVVFTEGAGCEPGGQASWKADHGGASWQAQHLPLILSGPGIRSGHTSSYPARLIDVAPTILQLMGASHKGMQGVPLADALLAPPSWTVRWQRTTRKRLMPVVTALQQQSRLELTAGR